MTVHRTEEPPVGFQVCYYDAHGLRSVPVVLTIHDGRGPEEVKGLLYQAYLSLCGGIQGQLPRNIRRLVRKTIDDGPEAA